MKIRNVRPNPLAQLLFAIYIEAVFQDALTYESWQDTQDERGEFAGAIAGMLALLAMKNNVDLVCGE